MNKNELEETFLKLQSFDDYLNHLEDFLGLPMEKELFRKQMNLMDSDSEYTHRTKEQLFQKKKKEIVKKLQKEIEILCSEISAESVYIPVDDSEYTTVNIVYLYPKGKREDINHAIALRCATCIETEENICYAQFPASSLRDIDLILFPVKNFFAGYDFLKIENDTAAAFLLRHNRILQIEYRMWKINNLIPKYLSLRSISDKNLRSVLKAHHDSIISERDAIYEKLINNGDTHAKWISEQKAYAIVKSIYPDAKFQYQPEWLHGQRLDIYIPSHNTGIEYQGRQHTEAVDFFGGEEGLKSNIERDRRKSYLCRINGVKLLYWNHDEPLTADFFKEKIGPVINEK